MKKCFASAFLLLFFISGCATTPASYLRVNPHTDPHQVKIALVPFTNLTTENQADRKVTYALITHLLKNPSFDLIEMGVTQNAMNDAKARKDEPLSLDMIKKIGELTGADVLLMGTVEEYKIDSSTMLGDKVFVPEVSINARLVSSLDGSIVWAANHHRRGDEKVTVFGMGRIESISALTENVVEDIIQSLKEAVNKKRGALTLMKSGLSSPGTVAAQADPNTLEELNQVKQEKESLARELAALKEKMKMSQQLPSEEEAQAAKDPQQEARDQFRKEYEKIKKQS